MLKGAVVAERDEMSDEVLADAAQRGDGAAQDLLMRKYKNLVRSQARAVFMAGADMEDIVQEGMIGLFKAVRDFDNKKSDAFGAFARMCVNRQILTAIRTAARQKHIPLNAYVSLERSTYGGEPSPDILGALAEPASAGPEETLIGQEEVKDIVTHMGEVLSRLESRVLALYLQGRSYREIASLVSRDEKSVENALQRVRRKMNRFRKPAHTYEEVLP